MTRPIKVKKAFEEFVEEYDKFMLDTKHTNARNKVLGKLREEINGEVLDVATGTGDVAIWIAKNTNATEIEGVDFSKNMIQKAIEKAKRENLSIKFSVQDVENLTYSNKIFDTIICCLGVCWFTNRKKALSELKRVCKDNGKIILLEEKGSVLAVQKLVKEETQVSEKIKVFEELEDYISIDEIKKLMNEIGCNLVRETEVIPIDENHGLMGLIFVK